MTVKELRRKLGIIEKIGMGDCEIVVSDGHGFCWERIEPVVFDDKIVIQEREE